MIGLRIAKQAVKAILRHKGRSFLTSLGIIIGVASVVSLLALGQGAQNSITSNLATLDTTTLTVRSGGNQGGDGSGPMGSGGHRGGPAAAPVSTRSTLTQSDLDALKFQGSAYGLSQTAGYVVDAEQLILAEKDSAGALQEQSFGVVGSEPDYFAIQRLELERGRALSDEDLAAGARVLVLGSQAAAQLFGGADPLGQPLVLNQQNYTVVGVLAEKAENAFSNPNNQLYGPYTSISATYGLQNFSAIYATAVDDASVDTAKSEVESVLESLHGKTAETRDFNVNSQKDILGAVTSITDIFTAVLGGIAGISLIVGGIGIMNIMLVAVTERTREIGLRMAVGAKTSHILSQFMIESVLLCLMGAVFGIAIGALLSRVVGHVLGAVGPAAIEASITAGSVLLAVSVSTLVGLIFGTYPAVKAARLNPVDALRYE